MEPSALLATVPPSSAALAGAARKTGVDAPVPTCPEWTVEQLVCHAGRVLRFVGQVVETGAPVDPRGLPTPPTGALVVQWFEEMAATTVDALAATNPEEALWNWSDTPHVAGFWHRRMAHELTIHSADAVLAAGGALEIDAALAADGIDEFLSVLLPAKLKSGVDLADMGTLHIHCTDTEGEWLVVPTEGGVEVTRAHAKGDVALRGGAADLLLRLYNRGAGGEVVGDAAVVDTFIARARF